MPTEPTKSVPLTLSQLYVIRRLLTKPSLSDDEQALLKTVDAEILYWNQGR